MRTKPQSLVSLLTLSTVNNNAWGDDGSGQSCLHVVDGGESWSVEYQWTGNPDLVKGFPRMKAHPSNLPVIFSNISALEFKADWSIYVKGTENSSAEEQAQAFDETYVRQNAAMDVFLSDDAWNSTQVGPPIEIMVWFWRTPSIIPLGYTESTPALNTVEVDGMNFSLYHGFNAQGQHVFSWLSERNMTSTDADYSPLLKYIWQKGLLSGALWLGQLEFGFEVMHAGEPTVSEVQPGYNLKIIRDGDPDDPAKSTSTTSSSTTTSAIPTFTSAAATTTSAETVATTSSSESHSVRVGIAEPGWLGVGGVAALISVAASLLFSALCIDL